MEAPSPPPPEGADVVVIGAGLVGLAAACEVARRRPAERVVVLERESAPAAHQSSHNSGVVHAGLAYRPGSLKARLCVEGARRLSAYCDARGVPFSRPGKLVVALAEPELAGLDALAARAAANGVRAARLGRDELREHEPHLAALAALHVPATGLVDFGAVARALCGDLETLGGTVATGCRVTGIDRLRAGGRVLHTSRGPVRARFAVFAAGAWSDRLARLDGLPDDPRVVPFRGAYRRLTGPSRALVRGLVYPVPDPRLPFLGVHFTPAPDGAVLVGPTAHLAGARDAYRLRRIVPRDVARTLAWPGTWRMARRHWRAGLTQARLSVGARALAAEVARFYPEARPEDLRPGPSGVRGQVVARDGDLVDDFLLAETEGALHVRNAPSPAATASLALADVLADRVDAGAARFTASQRGHPRPR